MENIEEKKGSNIAIVGGAIGLILGAIGGHSVSPLECTYRFLSGTSCWRPEILQTFTLLGKSDIANAVAVYIIGGALLGASAGASIFFNLGKFFTASTVTTKAETSEQIKINQDIDNERQQGPIAFQSDGDSPEQGFGIVYVSRRDDPAGRAVKVAVIINDQQVGFVNSKETEKFKTPAGNCIVYLKAWDSKSNTISFYLESNQEVSLTNRNMQLAFEPQAIVANEIKNTPEIGDKSNSGNSSELKSGNTAINDVNSGNNTNNLLYHCAYCDVPFKSREEVEGHTTRWHKDKSSQVTEKRNAFYKKTTSDGNISAKISSLEEKIRKARNVNKHSGWAALAGFAIGIIGVISTNEVSPILIIFPYLGWALTFIFSDNVLLASNFFYPQILAPIIAPYIAFQHNVILNRLIEEQNKYKEELADLSEASNSKEETKKPETIGGLITNHAVLSETDEGVENDSQTSDQIIFSDSSIAESTLNVDDSFEVSIPINNVPAPQNAYSEKEQITRPRPRLDSQKQVLQESKKSFTPMLIAILLVGLFLIVGFIFVLQTGIVDISNFVKNVNQAPISTTTNPTVNELSTLVAATIMADLTKTQAAIPATLTSTGQVINTPTIAATNSPIPQTTFVTQITPPTAVIIPPTPTLPNTIIFHNTPPTFVYPSNGGTIDYEGAYLFKVNPVQDADGYLWGFFQDGIMVWENLRDEGQLSGTEYGIHIDSIAHTKFKVGYIEVWVRARIAGEWTDPTVITLYLKSRSSSSFDFRVYANQGWQNTGISINAGDRIVIAYISDLWFTDTADGGGRDASGSPNQWICSGPDCHEPLHDFPKYALIGKIGDQTNILRIGNYLDFVANENGILYLRPNYGDEDIAVFNPAGSIVVQITIQP